MFGHVNKLTYKLINFLCFLFFSSYKACSFSNSVTLDAIVERAMLHDTIEYWIRSSDLHKILKYMVPIVLSSLFF